MTSRNGWRTLPLSEVAEVHDNLRMPINASERAARITGKREVDLFPYYGATGQVGLIDGYRMEGRFVLVGEDGAPFLDPLARKAYVVEGRTWVNNHAHILRGRPDLLDDEFLKHALNITDYRGLVNGTTRLKLTQAALRQIPILLPPLETQRRIVARIDALFSELDDGEAALARARADLETYRKSLLKAAVTGALTVDWRAANPAVGTGDELLHQISQLRVREQARRAREQLDQEGLPALPPTWAWSSFEQLVLGLRNGLSLKPANQPPGIPILRISSVRAMKVDPLERRWLPEDHDVGAAVARSGDLLFTRYNGNPELVGVCGRLRDAQPIAYPDKIMCATPVPGVDGLGDHLELAMNAGASRKAIQAATKTSAGQHGVSGDTVKRAPVPVPPLAEMREIVARFRLADTAGGTAVSEGMALADDSATLRQSILAAAFRGELPH